MTSKLEIAKEIALKAGELVMRYYSSKDFTVTDKGGYKEDFVTNADVEAQEFIFKELKKHFPDYGFIGEETFDNKVVEKEYIWIVDPIDGTRSFVKGTDQFCVLIGLAKNGEAILGVNYLPVENKLFYAEKGKGAFLNGERISVSDTKDINNMRMAISRRMEDDSVKKALYDKIKCETKEFVDSAGIKMCLVAEGKYDVTTFKARGANEWDFCAPSIIVEEAGGKVTDVNGVKLKFNHGQANYDVEILISNNQAHEEILDMIRK